ncbi:hypothetical protein [Cysteiniphilum sp. JM-1]|uniref:hypothetical protein n=1 Tax=Cysteiniphilum sp. JM-1 TaxID=2610891 RepID=UPI00124496B7|nr:hypothetical protein [Cysteiniphilum sp. JM-1]
MLLFSVKWCAGYPYFVSIDYLKYIYPRIWVTTYAKQLSTLGKMKKMKKIKKIISILSIAALLTTANTGLFAAENDPVLKEKTIEGLRTALSKVHDKSLGGDVKSIKHLKMMTEDAKKGKHLKSIIDAIVVTTTVVPQYNSFSQDALLAQMKTSTIAAGDSLTKALQNITKIDVMNQYIQESRVEFQNAWEKRISFLNAEEGTRKKAQKFNYFLDYLMLNGLMLSPNTANLEQATAAYDKLNVMAYELPQNAYDAYDKALEMTREQIFDINQDMLISELRAFADKSAINNLYNLATAINQSIEVMLAQEYHFKIFRKTIFSIGFPQEVKDVVHQAEKKFGMSELYSALQVLVGNTAENTAIPMTAYYSKMTEAAKHNVFAKLMVVLAQLVANTLNHATADDQFNITDEQAYYVVMYHSLQQLNQSID